MDIFSFKDKNYIVIREIDDTKRDIGYSEFKNIILIRRNYYNPNVLLYNSKIVSLYDEKVMSLNKDIY